MKLKLFRLLPHSICALFLSTASFADASSFHSTSQTDKEELMSAMKDILSNPSIQASLKAQFNDEEYLYRIHTDAYHYPTILFDSESALQLHDTSKWSVHPSQKDIIKNWSTSDLIFIKPKSSCFSMYQYVLQNRSREESVEASLIRPPLPTSSDTRWITNIDYINRRVLLDDQTMWQIDPSDSSFNNWQEGQRLIIGVNNHWRMAKRPHILINADLYKYPYSEGDFYGYYTGY